MEIFGNVWTVDGTRDLRLWVNEGVCTGAPVVKTEVSVFMFVATSLQHFWWVLTPFVTFEKENETCVNLEM